MTRRSFPSSETTIVVSSDGYFDVYPPVPRSDGDKPAYRGRLNELGAGIRGADDRLAVRPSSVALADAVAALVGRQRRRRRPGHDGSRSRRERSQGLIGWLPARSAGRRRLDPADEDPDRGCDSDGAGALVPDGRHGAQGKQHPEEDARGLLRVEVRADAPEPLLGGQVGGHGRGRAGRQRGAGCRHRLPALRGELGIGGHGQLQRQDLVPQAGEPHRGIGEVLLDRALARPRGQRGDPCDDRGIRLEDGREEQRRLVREVAVDRPLGDARRLGDRPGRGVGVADLADDARASPR